ncbi:MAG: hypothetical protein R2845_13770 [Thermomicrobiales bacterium]
MALASLIGLAGFLYPFIIPGLIQRDETSARQVAHAGDAPLLFRPADRRFVSGDHRFVVA